MIFTVLKNQSLLEKNRSLPLRILICSCYCKVPGALWEICPIFETIVKNKEQVKYLLMLHDATYNNYFIVECLLKLNVARIILLTY